MNTQARAFVLGMGVNGLGVTRSLGEAGVRVTGVDVTSSAPEFFSRYCDPLACPSPVTEPERVLELLLAEEERLDRPAVLLPAGDAFALFMSRYRVELGRRFLFALPPPSVSEALVDKWLQHQMAERAGIPCPRTFHPGSMADVARIKHEIDYPAFLKPCASHLWAPVFGIKGFRVDGPIDLERRLAEIAPSGLDVIVQSIVPGPNTNHYVVRAYFDESNRPLALYVQRKIRQYPTDFGNATLVESVRAPAAAELGARLLERLHYRGIAAIEFKRDVRTGELKLIEANPRIGQNNILATRCGANLPLIAYLDLTGQKPAPRAEYREGVRYLVVGKDVRAFLDYYRRGELGPVEWARSVMTARVFPYLNWRDPLPFVMAAGRGLWRRLLHFRRSRSEGSSRMGATMVPVASGGPHPAAHASRAPMRVLQFRSTFTFAGPERGLLTLGRPLQKLGLEVKIIAYYRWRSPEPPIHRLVEQGRRENLDVEQWDDRSWFSWRTVRRLAEELRRGGYDLLVTHDHKTDLMGYLAAQRSKTPCLSVAHGYDLSLLRMRLYRRVDLMVLRRFPRIVVVSDSLRQELIAAGLSSDRICVVPTAIDIARFAEGALDRASEWRRLAEPLTPVILTVGRLYRQKGLKYFVQSAARIHQVVPQARFWIAGEGVLRRQLEAQIRNLGLQGVVTLLGQQRDIAAVIAASDVFVMPSLGEGLSNVLLEAMALAKPVVATRVGGTPEVVREGETGWLVPPRQPAALATAVLKALQDPDLAARIGRQGRDFVANRFAATHVAVQMAEVYRQTAAPTRV